MTNRQCQNSILTGMEVNKRVAQLYTQVLLESLPVELNRNRHGLSL